MPTSQSDCRTQIPFQLFSLPKTFLNWTRSPNDGLLSAKVAGRVGKLTCRNKSVTSVWLVAGVHSQPSDHVRGEEGRREGATSTSTHTLPGSLQRTCRAGSSLRVWPQSRSLHRSQRATSCRISCPWTPWSSWLHSGKEREDKKHQPTKNMILAKAINTTWQENIHFLQSRHINIKDWLHNRHLPRCWWQTFHRL